MKEINLTTKTGFKVVDLKTPIVINDYRGIEFYNTTPLLKEKNRVIKFNLPKGHYTIVSGFFEKMKHPVKLKLAKLPKPERYFKPPFDFEIRFGDNPNKCTIYWKAKTIVFDDSFKEMPLPYVYFVLYHEYGHGIFKTEKLADLVASNLMKIKGFNLSQIYRAQINTLSDLQWHRKEFLSNELLKAQK